MCSPGGTAIVTPDPVRSRADRHAQLRHRPTPSAEYPPRSVRWHSTRERRGTRCAESQRRPSACEDEVTLLWAGLIVLGVTTVAIAAMLVVRRGAPAGSYFEDGDRASGIFGVIATGFAVLIGFVV